MKYRIIVPFFASLALCASAAMAQDAPPAPPAPAAGQTGHGPWHMNKEDMAKHHAQMCSDFYARAVGKLAYLETKLALTGAQKPAFDRWKAVVLSSVKARADECATAKMPDRNASVVEVAKLKVQRMKTRLADLQAQMPALESLAGSLNQEQTHIFDHAARAEMMEHMRGMHERGFDMHRGGRDGDHDGDVPPPPPSEQ
ncbi:MAG: Spy/CpxP family protein refolding chaperone [Rhizomicrobium sp.]